MFSQSFQLIVTETPPFQGSWQPVRRFLVPGSGADFIKLSDIPKEMTYDPTCAASRTPYELYVANRAAHKGKGYISVFIMSSDGREYVRAQDIRGNSLTDVHQVCFNPVDGELFATNWKSGKLSRFKFDKYGKQIPNGTITMRDSDKMLGVLVRKSDRQLFVSSYTFVRIFKRNPDGSYTYKGNFYPPQKGGLHYMTMLRKELYICEVNMGMVYRYTFDKNGYPRLKSKIRAPGAISVAFSLDGKEMYVASHSTSARGIYRFMYDPGKDKWVFKKRIITRRSLGGIAIIPVDGSNAFALYGKGCMGCNNQVPTISATGSSTPGNELVLRIHRGLPSGTGFVFLGLSPSNIPLPGSCTLLVGLPLSQFDITLDTRGNFWLPAALPPGFPRLTIYAQYFGIDPSSGNSFFSSSNGLKITIQ